MEMWSNPMVKRTLTKYLQNRLEFELRLQQYTELCRARKLLEAKKHAEKFLIPYNDSHEKRILQAAALLAYPENNATKQYEVLYVFQTYYQMN